MLSSLDGKISTGDTDIMDVDSDFPTVAGLKEGIYQYYDIEKTTDFFSLNSGRVFAKIGFNNKKNEPVKIPVTFVVIDNKFHLNENGIRYICKMGEKLILATTNEKHPAIELKSKLNNLEILQYKNKIDFIDMFSKLKDIYKAERVTIQSGGMLNAEFIRKSKPSFHRNSLQLNFDFRVKKGSSPTYFIGIC